MSVVSQAETLVKEGHRNFVITYEDGRTEKARLFIGQGSGEVCKFRKRSHRRGYYLTYHGIKSIEPSIQHKTKTKEQKWIDGWKKVQARLVASGLWPNLIEEIQVALNVGYSKTQEANELYWKGGFDEGEKSKVAIFQEKYPALVKVNDKGQPYIVTSILWHHRLAPVVKKMRFCKGDRNEHWLQQIRTAMDAGLPLHLDTRYQYDVSFEYIPEKKKAWYSEEYKNTGNGHYYLALDSTHALFYEDD
jgi:hypothetical protein